MQHCTSLLSNALEPEREIYVCHLVPLNSSSLIPSYHVQPYHSATLNSQVRSTPKSTTCTPPCASPCDPPIQSPPHPGSWPTHNSPHPPLSCKPQTPMLLHQGRFRIHSTFYSLLFLCLLLPPNKLTVFLNLPPEYCAGTSSTLRTQEGLLQLLPSN